MPDESHPYKDLPDVPRLRLWASANAGKSDTAHDSWENKAIDHLVHGIKELREDHASGAKDLATKALSNLVTISEIAANHLTSDQTEIVSSEKWWDISRKAGWYLCEYGRPSMGAAINSVITKSIDRHKLGLPADPTKNIGSESQKEEERKLIHKGIESLHKLLELRKCDKGGDQIRTHFRDLIQKLLATQMEVRTNSLNILTLSSSSTVKNAILSAVAGEYKIGSMPIYIAFNLRIMESRPLCEGASMAADLIKTAKEKGFADRLHIELASDSSVAMLAKDVDLVIFGADRIADTGNVCNKMGSYPAALCAKVMTNGKCHVATIAELEKVAKPGSKIDPSKENNDATELTSMWGKKLNNLATEKNVQCRNVYFEWVPAEYIDYYICEKGILNSKNIREQSLVAQKIEENVFKGLENI